jgi:zinc protease
MSQSALRRLSTLAMVCLLMLTALEPAASTASAAQRATSFQLDNGMDVVVIPDHRAPVVTHMVWYRVGAADERHGESGIAHFLEHLMFKATDNLPSGEFSKIVSRMGGQDNAFTGQDVTAYFQRISRDRLADVMRMEADRMTGLKLEPAEVATEREVVLEERRSRIENQPSEILVEQMNAALYMSHPYGTPIIGWMHEVSALSRDEAMRFYRRFYAPNNAVLVVAGDVTADEVRKLAAETYGKVAANPDVKPYVRPREPESRAARRVELKDARAGQPVMQRYYLAPSYPTAEPGEAEALDLLMKIVGDGPTSRLYRKLVTETKVASRAGGWFMGSARDYGKIAVYAIPAEGKTLADVEAGIDTVLAEVIAKGIDAKELERAKRSFLASHIYSSDSQSSLARRYGYGLVIGQTIAEIESWPDRIGAITADQVIAAAKAHLDIRKSVTGWLVPENIDAAASGEAVR